jgi:hypothetical protein
VTLFLAQTSDPVIVTATAELEEYDGDYTEEFTVIVIVIVAVIVCCVLCIVSA